MNISAPIAEPIAVDVNVDDVMLRVTLEDGREIAVPVAWFPRLRDATSKEASNWRLIGRGEGIHWPDIDEDISVEWLLSGSHSDAGRRSKSAA
jgi:hypothetical protein